MATITKFEDLEIWQEARILVKEIYLISKETDLKTDFKFKAQIKASSGSVMDNIAEGFERDGNLEFRQFLSIAKGSAGELRTQLLIAKNQNYIVEMEFDKINKKALEVSKKLGSFITYLKEFKSKQNLKTFQL